MIPLEAENRKTHDLSHSANLNDENVRGCI